MKTNNNKQYSKDVILKDNEFKEKFHNTSAQTDDMNLFTKMEDSNENGYKNNYLLSI